MQEQQLPRITVVIPTRNEAQNLDYVLPYIPAMVSEVILVDGHSTDDTIAIAKQLRPDIRVINQTRKGKGDALRIGFAAATGEIIVMIDADGSTDPAEIPSYIEALLNGYDFAKGSRFLKGGGSSDITPLRSLGNWGLSQLVNILFGVRYSDLCYGYNAFWRSCLDYIHVDCDGFEVETQMNIRAHKAGINIVEIPSTERPRHFGQSNLRTFRDGWRVLKIILSERVKYNQAGKKNVPVLMYHSISDPEKAAPKFKQFTVSPELFEEHMAYLHQQGYTPITVSQFVAARAPGGAGLPRRPVVLTFDDGFADFYTEALPILKKYGFTATLYITTGYVGDTSRWLEHDGEGERPMLTWKQIAEIDQSGIECGGHSHTHPQMDTLAYSASAQEIEKSKQLLEEHLGHSVESFAYPFGYHTANVRRQIREAGYTSASAVKHAMSTETTEPFALARWTVQSTTNIDSLAAFLGGDGLPMFSTMFMRARTPLWQIARRSSALMTRRFQEGMLAR
jgi:peptidoglycan/xylan/chitin deacetylase (PgdA/CDA1 family)